MFELKVCTLKNLLEYIISSKLALEEFVEESADCDVREGCLATRGPASPGGETKLFVDGGGTS